MPSQVAVYRDFELSAAAFNTAGGQAAQVCLTRHNGSNVAESILALPGIFQTVNAALDAAIDYGKAAVDGRVPGFDPDGMR